MNSPVSITDRILRQDKALVRAIEALGTIEPTGPFERALARLLMAAYKRRLRAIVEAAPAGWASRYRAHRSTLAMTGRYCGSVRTEHRQRFAHIADLC